MEFTLCSFSNAFPTKELESSSVIKDELTFKSFKVVSYFALTISYSVVKPARLSLHWFRFRGHVYFLTIYECGVKRASVGDMPCIKGLSS